MTLKTRINISKKKNKVNNKIYCFDLDGVICTSNKNYNYKLAIPIKKAIKKINEIYFRGDQVIIFTARFRTYSYWSFNDISRYCLNGL